MKKLFIGLLAILICVGLVGCGTATESSISSDIHSRMDRLSSELKDMNTIENSDIAFNNNGEYDESLMKVGLNTSFAMPNFYRNTDTYGNFNNFNRLGGVTGGYNGYGNGYYGNGYNGNGYNGVNGM
ncbi:MAG: hypothetical protein PHR96_02050 [Clostridia bacterium]|nr:hypothetical protein [Clostridia bacterium]